MVNEQLQNAARIAHDVGLATWFGGQVFGKFALNPVVRVIDDPATRGIRVVVVSADATPRSVERLLKAGARDYLTKPLALSQLFKVIDDLLAERA